jgi:hypothetical protein
MQEPIEKIIGAAGQTARGTVIGCVAQLALSVSALSDRHLHLTLEVLGLTGAGTFSIDMREEEWPIGSGMVESAAKQFKARFCGPGMHWSRTGAENLLPIRAAVLGARVDHMWAATKNLPPT